jgi:hypothetical protein
MSVGKWKIWMTGATGQIDAALVHLLVGESNAEVVMAARSP